MAPKSEIENTLEQALKVPGKIAEAQKKIDPVFKDLCAKTPAAVKDGDQEMIKFYLKAIRVELNSITAALQDIFIGLNLLKEVEDDEDFLAAHLKEVEDATKALSDARTKLTQQYESIKALENDAEKGLKSGKPSRDEYFRNIAKYDKFVTDQLKDLKKQAQEAIDPWDAAYRAVEERDAKKLADSQKKIKDMDIPGTVKYYETRQQELKDLLQDIDDQKYDAKLTSELKDGVNDLLKRLDSGKSDLTSLKEADKETPALKIVPINVKEALKILEWDAKMESKLAKVMKGPPKDFEKGLGALAKELKLKDQGWQLLEKLRKAEVL